MDTIIKNGLIVNAHESFKADVGIKNGIICCIGRDLNDGKARIVDAADKYVLPGGVEPHAHFSVPFFGTVSCDDYTSGTRAAAFGGVTTVLDFATQEKGRSLDETAKARIAMAQDKTYVDYSFHLIITDPSDDVLAEIPRMVSLGFPSIKVYMVYKKEGLMVDDAQMYRILKKTKSCGALLSVHAENPDIIDMFTDEFLAKGLTSAWYHYLSRPDFVAAEAGKRVIHWARSLKAPLYIVHVSDWETMAEIRKAQSDGYPIYAETCPQYLNFTDDVYKRPDAQRFICSPPMKGEDSRRALWAAVRDGSVSALGSDHCPFMAAEKDADKPFPLIPNGMMGIETRYSYILSEAIKGSLSLNRAVDIGSAGPAKLFGCRNKGSVEVGKDADIVILNPDKKYRVSQSESHSEVDHTVWEGYENYGTIEMTLCRGEVLVENGILKAEKGFGKLVRRYSSTP